MARVLVVDDDKSIRESSALALEKAGHRVFRAANAAEARAVLDKQAIDVVVSDIYMPGEDGIELLQSLASRRNSPAVILMTARGTIETATIAARVGAFDYLAKPFDVATLLARVRAAVTPPEDVTEPPAAAPDSMIVGVHPSMVAMYMAITRVAPLVVPVLIHGESGSGKELVARAIHTFGARADGPFVPINCGAIPDTLLESELFGAVRGAYTDARQDRRGALARGDHGTIFLDEIGDTSPSFQVKLLRFLQDGIVTPLGSEKSFAVDVRIIAATHRNIRDLVKEGRFREDLFFRLAGYEIEVPPLRERASDIPILVDHMRRRLCDELGRESIAGPSMPVLEVLQSHPWPGNVRELEQVVRRIVIDTGALVDAAEALRVLASMSAGEPAAGAVVEPSTDVGSLTSLEEVERRHILTVLKATGGNQTRAAYILGIERNTLARKMKRFGIPTGSS
jgi:DNA-binding NtrC family response regulator